MGSYKAMNDFISRHNLDLDNYGNCTFDAIIEYSSQNGCTMEKTEVKFVRNGYEDGKIGLTANNVLSVDKFHLDFSTDFQKYSYSEFDSKLTISGTSGKMGGKYTVQLYPTV